MRAWEDADAPLLRNLGFEARESRYAERRMPILCLACYFLCQKFQPLKVTDAEAQRSVPQIIGCHNRFFDRARGRLT